MDGYSVNIKQEQIERLKEIFPEVVTEGKVDWEKLKATLSEDINFANERYVLNWAGKSDAFKALDVQTSATLKPVPEESINFNTTQNIFIEGENLEVLKVLRKSYYGKIKCIIIDPPYNTGSDSFIYPDSFKENKADYEKRIGDKDEEGYLMKEGLFRTNSKESGHFHSNWLSMMYPRLFIGKSLLTEDGVIFVHCDDNEVHNLKLLLNEIFGEENFVGQIIWKNVTDNNPTLINLDHEYIFCYARSKTNLPQAWKSFQSDAKDLLQAKYIEFKRLDLQNDEIEKRIREFINDNFEILGFLTRYKNVDDKGIYTGSESVHNPKAGGYVYDIYHPTTKGKMRMPSNGYRFPYESYLDLDKEKKILYGEDENRIIKIKKYLEEFEDTLRSVIVMDGRLGSYDIKRLFKEKVFNNPKPIELLTYLLSFVLDKSDTVLDFFSGSGSTGDAILHLNRKDGGNRKFILVQLPELIDPKSEAYKAGYKTISEVTKERIRRSIKRLSNRESSKIDMFNSDASDLGFKVFKLSPSNFKVWRSDEITEDNLVQQLEAFTNPVKEESNETNMLYELLIKAGYLLTAKVESKGAFYSVNDNEMVIALKAMNTDVVTAILAAKPKKVLTLDNLFAGIDQLKTNTVLQMRDAGIDFKTI